MFRHFSETLPSVQHVWFIFMIIKLKNVNYLT